MSKYARGHRVYIVEYRGLQKIGVAPHIFAIEKEYHIAPWLVRIFQLMIANIARYCSRILQVIYRLDILPRITNRIIQQLGWLAMRTPSTIKYLSVPMEHETAKSIEKAMYKKLDSLYGKENYSSGWCEISKFNIDFLKRWVVDSTLEK